MAISLMDASTKRASLENPFVCLDNEELNPKAIVFQGKVWLGMSLRVAVHRFSQKRTFFTWIVCPLD